MGQGYGALYNECGERFEVNEGSGMIAMPFHCDLCGKEWWWEFGPGGPMGKGAGPIALRVRGDLQSQRAAALSEVPLRRRCI